MVAAAAPPGFEWKMLCALLGLATVCCLFGYLHARFSGWAKLARTYRMDQPPVGGVTFRSYEIGFMDRMHPGRSARATLTSQGLYFAPPLGSRSFHPPLLLPWTLLGSMAIESDGFSQLVRLYFEDAEGTGIDVPLPKAAIPTIRALTGRSDFSGEVLR